MRLWLGILVLVAGCTYLHVPQAPRVDALDWPTDGRTPARVRVVPEDTLALPLKVRWRYNARAGFGPASPLIVDAVVWVGTRRGEVHALRLHDGKGLGSRSLGEAIEGGMHLQDRLLVVPVARGRDALVALDVVTGQVRWRFRTFPIEAGVLVYEGRAIAADVRGTVYGIAPDAGRLDWQYTPDSIRYVRAAPVGLPGGRVAIAYATGEVVVLDGATGAFLWKASAGAPVWETPATDGRNLFVSTTRGAVVALSLAEGTVRWRHSVGNALVKLTGPAVSAEGVVVGGTDGWLRMLDPETGQERWHVRTEGGMVGAPLVVGNRVFVGTLGRKCYAVSLHDGRLQWSAELRGRVKSAPAYAEGTVVVLSEPGDVYGFQVE